MGKWKFFLLLENRCSIDDRVVRFLIFWDFDPKFLFSKTAIRLVFRICSNLQEVIAIFFRSSIIFRSRKCNVSLCQNLLFPLLLLQLRHRPDFWLILQTAAANTWQQDVMRIDVSPPPLLLLGLFSLSPFRCNDSSQMPLLQPPPLCFHRGFGGKWWWWKRDDGGKESSSSSSSSGFEYARDPTWWSCCPRRVHESHVCWYIRLSCTHHVRN